MVCPPLSLPPHPLSNVRGVARRLPWVFALLLGIFMALSAADAQARTMTARIERVDTAIASLQGVQVQLAWPPGAVEGELRLRARRADAPELGYRFTDLDWRCPLQRDDAGGWRCAGPVRSAGGSMQLAVEIGAATTDARLSGGGGRIGLHRDAATPDVTRIDLTRIPLVWLQALLSQAWSSARLVGGTGDARLTVTAADAEPLRIAGPVALHAAALDTADGSIAAESVDADFAVDARLGGQDSVVLDGRVNGGELLFGSTYVALEERSTTLRVVARQRAAEGWQLPELHWSDPGILLVDGSAALDPDANLTTLDLRLQSPDLKPLRDAYLSGWLGMAGMGDLQLEGSMEATVQMREGALADAMFRVHGMSTAEPDGRFAFSGLDGNVEFSATRPVNSELRWREGAVHGLAFGAARLPFESGDGSLRLREAVEVPILGGRARFDHLRIQPPRAGEGIDLRFGLALERIDVAKLSAALDWPAFTGELSGRIPEARYADETLVFDGGLDMQLFGGRVGVSALSMERPFGVLPTLSADIVFDDIDLLALTGAFDFGSISGKLDGRIGDLRLVSWEPVAFDAQLVTDRHRGVRQRISQRAVQDLTSVGNASFVNSLQSQLIGFFDDFGYSKIGIGCRLLDEVCTMDGIGSAGNGFVIVRGSGLPRLTVVGFNRRVDWPILVERLAAVGKGDVKPLVD
jgi:hypothetical protein